MQNLKQKFAGLKSTLLLLGGVALIAGGFALGFYLGAQFMYVGKTSKLLNDNWKGATVYLSGQCTIFQKKDRLNLLDTQVKLVSTTDETLTAVLVVAEKTLTINCPVVTTTIDMLPFPVLSGSYKTAQSSRVTIEEQVEEKVQRPDLAQKTIVASAICVTAGSNEKLPPFTDRLVDVLSVEDSTSRKGDYDVYAIRKEDSLSIVCPYKSMKFRLADPQDLETKVAPVVTVNGEVAPSGIPTTYRGKTLLVTSACRFDRSQTEGRDIRVNLLRDQIEVMADRLSANGEMLMLKGAQISSGFMVECDAKESPINFIEKNPGSYDIKPITPTAPRSLNAVGGAKVNEANTPKPNQFPNVNRGPAVPTK